ncbi:MAG: glutamine--tRNA ligase/YqeY domain fusion protein [Gemmataceae bacterium]
MTTPAPPAHFIEEIVADDLRTGKHDAVRTRFPPEPNGYLHIGHAKSICLNFGLARKYGGACNLRFDDTNPEKEEQEYVDSIMNDVRWLGFDWDGLFYASDYFERLYQWGEQLIRDGKAYVDDQTAEEVAKGRGDLKGGKESPYRDRPVEESLDLFRRMRAGEFPDGAKTLRAKIDMNSPNFNLRDPVLYRILRAHHHRTGDTWCIYPMYDYAHGQSDSIEKITHSICTLEFENHRPLYDWFIQALGIYPPRQIEFSRLNLTYTVMSKRKLLHLVKGGHVAGWDDPRMPTLSGVRRRGFTPEAMRAFCERIGVSKFEGLIDAAWLEDAVRDDLNKRANRALAVLRPLKLVITNYPDGQTEQLEAVNNPEDASAGTRRLPFSKYLYIERDDFMENPPKDFHRLAVGKEVRLRYAYIIQCTAVTKDADGNVIEVQATYDPETKSGGAAPPRKVKGTIHWVSAADAVEAEVRLYDHLFKVPEPRADEGWLEDLNPSSLVVLKGCMLEPSLGGASGRYQFERNGYFCPDEEDSRPGALVFNRIVALRDTWAKQQGKK